jgi:O-Antigen ligase
VPWSRLRPLSLAAELGIIGAASLVAAVVLSREVVHGWGLPLLALGVAIPVLVWLVRRPFAAVFVGVVLVCSVFGYKYLPGAGGAGLKLWVPDIVLLCILAGTVQRVSVEGWPRWLTPIAFALGLYLAIIALESVRAVAEGVSTRNDATEAFRAFPWLLVALVVALEPRRERLMGLFDACLVVAAVTGAFSVVAALAHPVGHWANHLSSTASVASVGEENYGGLLRIRMPGLSLGYLLLIPACVLAASETRRRGLRLVCAVALAGGVAVSFNRNMWAGLVLGALAATALLGPRLRLSLGGRIVPPLAALAAVGVIVCWATPLGGPIVRRASSFLTPTRVQSSSSARDRHKENKAAEATIGRHLITGLGPRADYGVEQSTSDGMQPVQWVHNQYLELAVFYGIPAVIAFGVFLLTVAGRVVPFMRTPGTSPVVPALIASEISLLASAYVAIYLTLPTETLPLGLLLGFQLGLARPEALRVASRNLVDRRALRFPQLASSR